MPRNLAAVGGCEVNPECHQHNCEGCESVANEHCMCSSRDQFICHGYRDERLEWVARCRRCSPSDHRTLYKQINEEHEAAIAQIAADERSQEVPRKKIFKGDGPAETKIVVYRHIAKEGSKGGLELYLKSPAIEEWIYSISRPIARENLVAKYPGVYREAPPLYQPVGVNGMTSYAEGWSRTIDLSGVMENLSASAYGHSYTPSFSAAVGLIGPQSVNCSFLRAEGLAEGVTFKLEGVYPLDEIRVYKAAMERVFKQIYNGVLKELKVTITVRPEAVRVAA